MVEQAVAIEIECARRRGQAVEAGNPQVATVASGPQGPAGQRIEHVDGGACTAARGAIRVKARVVAAGKQHDPFARALAAARDREPRDDRFGKAEHAGVRELP